MNSSNIWAGMVLLFFAGLGFLFYSASTNDTSTAERMARLPQVMPIGTIATSRYTALYLYEFEHPKRPDLTCLFAEHHGPSSGLTCYKRKN